LTATTKPGEAKRALRSELLAARARLTQLERSERSRAIAERLEELRPFTDAPIVALYAPLGTEVDSLEIARRAVLRGTGLVFPRVVHGERRLVFARAQPADLVRGPLGASEPPPGAPEVDRADVRCVVTPGIGFSLDGVRLGRGGGHYDATLAAMPHAFRIGVAFEEQLVPALPREPHDAPLDAVVTERRTILFERESG
jgi:5-formyltetrahydrofolate cyclo-ligase